MFRSSQTALLKLSLQLSKSQKKLSTTAARLTYALTRPNNTDEMNKGLREKGFFVYQPPRAFTSAEKSQIRDELNQIHDARTDQDNQAAVVRTQFAVHQEADQFVVYPIVSRSPLDVAYESLIEPRPVLSSTVVTLLAQLLHIDELAHTNTAWSCIVLLLRYRTATTLDPHQDAGYPLSLIATLNCTNNMKGSNSVYDLSGNKLGEYSDGYHKIVDNTRVLHDATVTFTNPADPAIRDALVLAAERPLGLGWWLFSDIRSGKTLLPTQIASMEKDESAPTVTLRRK